MLETLLRDIDATDLNAFARTMTTPADFELTRTVMPERRLNSVKFRIKSSKRRVNAAKFRAYDAQTAVARRQAEKIITEGMLPPLGQKLIVGELEQILLDTASGADSSEFVELLYDDIERHVESIHNRMELAAGDLLVDGKFSLNGENGLTLEADFGVPAANMPTAAKPWSDPTSDPIADELRWIEYLRSIGAPLPARVLTSYKARATLAANDAYRAAYYGTVGAVETRQRLHGSKPGQGLVDVHRGQERLVESGLVFVRDDEDAVFGPRYGWWLRIVEAGVGELARQFALREAIELGLRVLDIVEVLLPEKATRAAQSVKPQRSV